MNPERHRRVMEILGEAIERVPDQRETWIAAACAGDETLHAEVARLLERQEEAAQFLEESPLASGAKQASNGRAMIGERVGLYKIVSEIGRGGMGAVYLAERDDQQFTKRVAIKLIKRGMDTDFVVQRFRNERQILANLDHPNIAKLLDGGTIDSGLPYFIMEYVEGEPISEFAKTNDLSINERLRLFRIVCAAVQYAHQNLVIHRDIKPSNILVTKDGEPKLLDFGIAKLLQTDAAEETALTATAVRVLTPEYASPEQIKGERVTTSSDVYSLGVLLYELLTGRRPYRVKSRQPEEMAKAICEQEPQRPSQVVSGQWSVVSSKEQNGKRGEQRTKQLTTDDGQRTNAINPKLLRGDLDNIVLKALRKEPARRYASLEQFSEDIRRHLEGLPVSARKDTLRYRTSKFVQRNKLGVAAAAIILLTLVGGIIGTAWEARKARAESARAQQRFNQVRKLAHSVLFDYHDEIAALPGSTQARQKLVKDSLEYLDSLASEASNDISLQREIGTAYQRIGEIQGGNITSSRGGTITFANLGDTQGALESFRKALAIRERLAALQPTNTDIQQEWGTNVTRMGEVSLTLGKPTDALNYFQKATAIYDKLLAADPSNEVLRAKDGSLPFTTARALGIPGGANLGRGPDALLNIRKALAIYEALAVEHPTQSRYRDGVEALHGNIGRVLFNEGRPVEALEEYRQSQGIAETLVKEGSTNAFYRRQLAITYGNMGSVLLALGKKAEALESCRQSVSILEALVAADPNDANTRTDLANNYRNLADALAANGDSADAKTNFDKAIQILTELTMKNPSNALISYSLSLACLKRSAFILDKGNLTESSANAREVIKISEALLAIDSANASARGALAAAYYQLGRCAAKSATSPNGSAREQTDNWREAKDWYQKSVAIYQEMKSKGTLSGADANKPDELEKEIAKCDTVLNSR